MSIRTDTDNKYTTYLPCRLAIWVVFTCLALPSGLRGQCTLACNSSLQISLPATGSFTVPTSVIAPSAATLCPGPLELTMWSAPGQTIPNNNLTCDHVGTTVLARVKHVASGNYCNADITVVDMLPPTLTCPTQFVACSQETSPYVLGFPTITDNCTPTAALNTVFLDQNDDLPCGTTQNGTAVLGHIQRTWASTDAQGNANTCLQHIWIKAPQLDSVVFPLNLDDIVKPSLSCGQDPQDLELTGQPTLYGALIENAGPCNMGITHSDQTIAGCSPGSYTLLRTWLAVDFCTSQIRQRIQIIKVRDKVSPVVSAPDTLVFPTSATDCAATFNLPSVTATDDCSAVTVQPQWAYGTGYGPFQNVPEGYYTVTWLATDACGNSAATTSVLQVKDDKAPNVACTTGLQVSLGTNGEVLVNASSLNAGSWDNCGPVFLSVSRDGTNWASTVNLKCADENQPIMVQLRVTDVNGLSNICEVPITPRDFMKPNLTCPPNTTLTCVQDPYNLTLTGNATASDNCTLQSLTHQNIGTLSGCNTGTVTRRWLATDQAGNTRTCDQTIVVNAVSSVNVAFPPNVTLQSCASPLNLTPAGTGSPTITGTTCFPLNPTYTDEILAIAPPACFTVLRTWKVIDHCVYNPNGGTQGIWQHVQQINVIDQSAPLLQIPDAITVSVDAFGCGANVNLAAATATDCSPSVTITHTGPLGSGGANASGYYPTGVHTLTFLASDGCGNSIQKTTQITVRDEVSPSAICLHGLSLNIGSGGAVILAPQYFNGNSTDNCTPADSLVFSVSPPYFSCQQLGQQQVLLTVTDKAGNTAQCETFVQVQDNQALCPRYTIEGDILTPIGQPVHGVRVYNGQGDTTYTDTLGHYKFLQLMPGKEYVITPELLANWINGMSAYDFVLISRHIMNLEPLSTPEKIIAADANSSGTVTTFDIVQMRKVLLGTLPGVPDGKSWRFLPANWTFSDPANPFVPAFPESVTIPGLESNQSGINFKAIKLGDMDGNVDTVNPY